METKQQIFFYHEFRKINYSVWLRIIQDLLSYAAIQSDLEWYQEMKNIYIEIKQYIDLKGTIPDEAKEQGLNDNIHLLKKQIDELNEMDVKSPTIIEKINNLNKELKKNEEELTFYLKYLKHNRFVYKQNKSGNQFFSRRRNALEIQSKMILNLIDDIDFSKRLTDKKIKTLDRRIQKNINIKDFDVYSLYKYIKPYIDVIMSSRDMGYNFLQKNLKLDY